MDYLKIGYMSVTSREGSDYPQIWKRNSFGWGWEYKRIISFLETLKITFGVSFLLFSPFSSFASKRLMREFEG